jgi:hypothetical protein
MRTNVFIFVAVTTSLLQLWIREDMEGRLRESVMNNLAGKEVQGEEESASAQQKPNTHAYTSRLPGQ